MQESKGRSLLVVRKGSSLSVSAVPTSITQAGAAAKFAWDEFFKGKVSNRHTRTAYLRAVRRFLDWSTNKEPEIARITPGMVGEYFGELPLSVPSKKLHLAAKAVVRQRKPPASSVCRLGR